MGFDVFFEVLKFLETLKGFAGFLKMGFRKTRGALRCFHGFSGSFPRVF